MSRLANIFSLEKQLPSYGAYHADSTNISIHMIFVPTILYTVFVFLANTGPLLTSWPTVYDIPFWPKSLPIPEPNAATLLALTTVPGYIAMQPFAGVAFIPILYAMIVSAKYFLDTYGAKANTYATALHVVSWIFQFAGHFIWEGRKPALLDNIFQAFYLAPFFVWLEFLFGLGFLPETHKKLNKLTAQKRAEVLAADKKKVK